MTWESLEGFPDECVTDTPSDQNDGKPTRTIRRRSATFRILAIA